MNDDTSAKLSLTQHWLLLPRISSSVPQTMFHDVQDQELDGSHVGRLLSPDRFPKVAVDHGKQSILGILALTCGALFKKPNNTTSRQQRRRRIVLPNTICNQRWWQVIRQNVASIALVRRQCSTCKVGVRPQGVSR